MNSVREKTCSVCQNTFGCGNPSETVRCWCNDLPPIFNLDNITDCLCPKCLKHATIKKIDDYVNTITPENSCSNIAKDLPKTTQLVEDIDYYLENGNYVFTKWFHLKRGSCCGNKCRHCPYN